MIHLTYIISFVAIVVVGRAFFSSDKKDVNTDTTDIIVQESIIIHTVNDLETNNDILDSLVIRTETTATHLTETQPLIINEVSNTQNNGHWSLTIDNWPLPATINHPVTFFPQAPDGNWKLPWAEACEEASIALAAYFIKGKELTRDQFRSDLLALVDRQMELFNDYIHTTVAQTKELYLDFYGGDAYILDNPHIDDIKSILAQWHIIVAPFAGRKLGNPYYSGQWPWYHMMVIRGYDDTHFYTNDVWTRRGENFKYSHATIMDALHDLDYKDINQGAKRILVITK
jgi:hypothetical protein